MEQRRGGVREEWDEIGVGEEWGGEECTAIKTTCNLRIARN